MTAVPPSVAPEPLQPAARPYDPDKGMLSAFIAYGLLLVSLFTGGVSAFLGLILAYDRRVSAAPVPATHFAFQIKVFWLCFLLSLAAGALWFGALYSLITHMPAPQPIIHGQPDAQLVSLGAPLLQPADVEVWSYHFNAWPEHLPLIATAQFWLGCLAMGLASLISWAAPIWGMLRLAAGRPIGRPIGPDAPRL